MFDELLDRKNTDCIKYDDLMLRFGREDLLPMWVADMDFKVPDFIMQTLAERIKHPSFGYGKVPTKLKGAICEWQKQRNNLVLNEDELILTLGVVQTLVFCILALTKEGDEVIIQTPVYTPFFDVVKHNDRVLIQNPLKKLENSYEMDFEALKNQITPKTKMLILCSPHNPVGRVWSEEELKKLCEICSEKGVIILSDEIHGDIVFKSHTPILKFDYENLILIGSPSKTFNTPGIAFSYVAIKNKALREKVAKRFVGFEISGHQILNHAVALSAYENGANYVDELVKYLGKSKEIIKNALGVHMARFEPEATYLYWLDFANVQNAKEKIYDKAKIALNRGAIYGENGVGFYRMNFAVPHSILEKALHSLKTNL